MGDQTVRRGSTEDRSKVEEAVLATLERFSTGTIAAMPQSSILYELATKYRASEIDRALQRLSKAKKIVFFSRLRGWFLVRFEKQGQELVSKLDAKQQKKNMYNRMTS